jgi:hypothetical protein
MIRPRHLRAVLGDLEPIDPRRGLRIAAETNREQAARRNRQPTAFLIDRAAELERERDTPAGPE